MLCAQASAGKAGSTALLVLAGHQPQFCTCYLHAGTGANPQAQKALSTPATHIKHIQTQIVHNTRAMIFIQTVLLTTQLNPKLQIGQPLQLYQRPSRGVDRHNLSGWVGTAAMIGVSALGAEGAAVTKVQAAPGLWCHLQVQSCNLVTPVAICNRLCKASGLLESGCNLISSRVRDDGACCTD